MCIVVRVGGFLYWRLYACLRPYTIFWVCILSLCYILPESSDHATMNNKTKNRVCLGKPTHDPIVILGTAFAPFNLCTSSNILGSSSLIRNGFVTTSSYTTPSAHTFTIHSPTKRTIPASKELATCSPLALPVHARTGTCPCSLPCCCHSRILRTHVKPSMTGISWSRRMTDKGVGAVGAGVTVASLRQ